VTFGRNALDQLDFATKTMPEHARCAKLFENLERTQLAFPAVHDDGLVRVDRQPHETLKHFVLLSPEGFWNPITVEPNLAYRNCLGRMIANELDGFLRGVFDAFPGVVDACLPHGNEHCVDGIKTERWAHERFASRKLKNGPVVLEIEAIADNARQARLTRPIEDNRQIGSEISVGKVCVNVEKAQDASMMATGSARVNKLECRAWGDSVVQ
jgi:hypothetical protein